ncbi:MAG: hypothetical protein JWO52_5902 [Gammaproteobacteria bacterium]|jgi:hypothetical protein|nr:hypothetical protein [Gammaproteobacteria bacterium]
MSWIVIALLAVAVWFIIASAQTLTEINRKFERMLVLGMDIEQRLNGIAGQLGLMREDAQTQRASDEWLRQRQQERDP